MSDAEALMWNIEKDPWLSSNIGTLVLLDKPIDADRFQKKMAGAIAGYDRLTQRVVSPLGRWAPPRWETDPEFDLRHHLQRVALPSPGVEKDLLDLTARVIETPFDRTRPLWQFVVVDGLADGRGALILKLHHSLSDGEGAIRLAEAYMDFEADPPEPAPAADDSASHVAPPKEAKSPQDELREAVVDTTRHNVRRTLGVARRVAAEAALTMADPTRLQTNGDRLTSIVRSTADQLDTRPSENPSTVWVDRSRHRALEVLQVPFAPAKNAARALGGTINDLFVTGAVAAGSAYHEKFGEEPDSFRVTFVVSTRNDGSAGGNAFAPAKATLPAGPMPADERFHEIARLLADERSKVGGDGLLSELAGVANLFPTSLLTQMARDQVRSVDIATSNLRSAPFQVFVAGSAVEATYPIGPVAGTAWNITMMSYNGNLDIGIHIDPVAVTDPELLRQMVEASFAELLTHGAE